MSENGEPQSVPLAEKVVMGASVAFTVSLFAFAVWNAIVGASTAAPTVEVTDTETVEDGVRYTVAVRNTGDVGFVSVTVSAGCTEPPTDVVVEDVPGGGRSVATVVCPPGTTDPDLSVSSWVRQ